MNQDPLYDIFHFFSRILIVIPVGILVVGLVMRFGQVNTPLISSNTSQKTTVTKSPTIAITPGVQLNLQGPFVCQFSTQEATISAYIKDKSVYGLMQQKNSLTNILLQNDCVYIWVDKQPGKKTCGLSPYISLLETLPINTILSNGVPSGILGNLGGDMPTSIPIKQTDIKSLINSCKKQNIQDMSLFKLPKNIVFQEKKL